MTDKMAQDATQEELPPALFEINTAQGEDDDGVPFSTFELRVGNVTLLRRMHAGSDYAADAEQRLSLFDTVMEALVRSGLVKRASRSEDGSTEPT